MSNQNEINSLFDRIINGQLTDTDIETLRQLLASEDHQLILQLGKYNVNIDEGKDIHIGDKVYLELNSETIQAIADQILNVFPSLQTSGQVITPMIASVDELVQQVRSHIHDDIQSRYGKMRPWGIDYHVPLGDLFVDVNILEELSSSRRSEIDDLWKDFSQNPNYRSLDRIGFAKKRNRVSGLEVLKKNNNLMVVGKPGSGKTTYLQRIVTECNTGNIQSHLIPALIKLREFVDDGCEANYLLERYLEECWQLSNTETKLLLSQGRVLVLLDGLDEVAGENGKEIAKEIKKFTRKYPKVKTIITCRTQSQESRFSGFDYVEVADFDESQMRSFSENWSKAVMSDDSVALSQQFLRLLFSEENKQIRELTITPILLSLACVVFFKKGKFYPKRSMLYKDGLEILLEEWDREREIERDEIYRELSLERKLELLRDKRQNKVPSER